MQINRFQALTVTEDEHGNLVTVGTFEGAADDVASYVVAGDHDDAEHVLRHGHKLTQGQARALGAGWPKRLTYRR